jgi:hypothetical protein
MTTRNAIIISCPGRGKDHLPGPDKDLKNMSNYLTSPRGGAWRGNEIFCLNNPAWHEVRQLLEICIADYQFIYFAGHGCSGDHRERYLSFRDQNIEDTMLLTLNPRQLIIVDACRVYYPAISGIPPAADIYSSFTGESDARIAFDKAINASGNGKMILHATQDNTEASEALHGRGGVFTLSLLLTANNFKSGVNLRPVKVTELLPMVKETMLSKGYEQTPEIPYKTGNLLVPFLIETDQIVMKEVAQEEEYIEEVPRNKPSLFGILALGVVIIALLGGFND